MEPDFIQEVTERHGYLSWLGVEADEAEEGHVVLSLEHDSDFTNSNGGINGGILSTLIDYSSIMAVKSTADEPDELAVPTTNLNVSFMRPAMTDVAVEATVLWQGGSSAVTFAEISELDDRERTLTIGTASVRTFDRSAPS